MTIAVFSDSHGSVQEMRKILKSNRYDLCVHLGNDADDLRPLRREFSIPFYAVHGNQDTARNLGETIVIILEGIKLYITHGHRLSVKRGLSLLTAAAREEGAHIALFGHTHLPYEGAAEGILLYNPGTVSGVGTGLCTFGELTLAGGEIRYRNVTFA
ncbi:metallophosphoesterase [Oscillospiraceae bacterium OttesenSCG-928-G22]|nr:metallophosphoesterase [Oscillospiraceae bacterium OttesenSCG-928-G22]